jgi:hypothetical protein
MAAILMALVVIATAWSAYQSTLWGGIQTFTLREVTSASQKVTMTTLQQGQYTIIDILMFMEYIDALNNNDQKLSEFYFDRFRPDFKPAVEAWLETKPFENPDAPSHPFVMTEYRKIFSEEAERFATESAIKLDEAQQANQNSDNYVLMTVIYASVLFIGGIFSRFSGIRRLSLVVVGWWVFSIATFFLLSMPVAPLFG